MAKLLPYPEEAVHRLIADGLYFHKVEGQPNRCAVYAVGSQPSIADIEKLVRERTGLSYRVCDHEPMTAMEEVHEAEISKRGFFYYILRISQHSLVH